MYKTYSYIKANFKKDDYIFWPDRATAHYARSVTEELDKERIMYVKKHENPPNVPQCRVIEDFFGLLADRVYHNNWVAATTHELQLKIEQCINILKTDNIVRALGGSTKKRLRKAYVEGVYNACH